MNKSAISLLLLAGTMPAWAADNAAPSRDRLAACAAIQDSAQRLACFDQQVAATPDKPAARAVEPKAPATPAAPAKAPQPEASAGAAFGADQLNKKSRDISGAQVLHAKVTELKEVGAGLYLVYLDNGQAWRHEDSVQGAFLREGEAISITKGTLGSYRLTRDAGQARNWIRVTRVK